ncbi:MAG: 3-hydroxyacyl-CoA dehydrogenase/enoyl-CoA hydratase family protein [Chloroflexi bacterium]|nr:3-hydroxyacyl-CoA dehydrogenase/enoyl-CoA hydratase family protein [Chloroflexota bacterium]
MEKYTIRDVVVVGAGTMGAAIAAHLLNAGLRVTLLDIAPDALSDEEKGKGLSLDAPEVRSRIVRAGWERAVRARPANLFAPDLAEHIRLGNLEDDFECIRGADWVLEVVLERLDLKRDLMSRIDAIRKETSIISTNTSGIPVSSIAEGRSQSFREHFLGTHFFNPPRYLKLLEVIPTAETRPEVLAAFRSFGERRLGKGVVLCKDTPNFIANRIGSVTGAFALNYILEHGYTVPQVEAITGPVMGRPKTATFRLLDLVGVDIADHVRGNLAALIPQDALAQEVLNAERVSKLQATLIERGWLGNKTGVGFYKTVKEEDGKEFWPLNLETLEHEPPGEKTRFDSIGKIKDIEDAAARIKALMGEDDRAAELARAMVYFGFAYASHCVPEVADNLGAIDDAVRWGFMHALGPFELWDALGVAETCTAMREAGYPPADWVDEMRASGAATFYEYVGTQKTAVYYPDKKTHSAIDGLMGRLSLVGLREEGRVLRKNDSATLIDLGDGIACVEFHTKVNALDADIGKLMMEALDCAEMSFDGLVIGNEAENFSAGANLFMVVMLAQQGMWAELDELIKGLQDLNMRMRYFHKPVVAAPAGLALGGGVEVIMHAGRVVAHSELYAGLVELGAGVIPAGGGTKEMLRRLLNPPMRADNADPLPYLERIFLQVGQAKVATSALEARQFGILGPADRIVMNRDTLLAEAKREARYLHEGGYVPPTPEKIYAAGRDMLAALRIGIYMFEEGRYISEYDSCVAGKLAHVMTGGDLSRPAWVDEQYILDLEREAFLSLCGDERTQQRMWHLLQTGKPLRN